MFIYECYHDDYGDKWISKSYIAETPGKAKYQHADFLHNELNYGEDIFSLLKDMKVRKLGIASIQFYFNYNDTWENTKKWRNLDFAELGMEIDMCGKRGVIVGGNSSLNLDVIFNYGTKQQYICNCHPHYETVYYDKEGNILADYREPKEALV